MGDRVAYFEVGSRDFDTLVSFYRDLFDWQVTGMADGYAMVDTRAGGGIGGGIGRSSDGTPWVSFYVGSEDPQATLDRAGSLGGATVVPVTEVPGVVTFAMFSDPDGNLVGVVETTGAEGPFGAGGRAPATASRSTGSRSWAPTPSAPSGSTATCSSGN